MTTLDPAARFDLFVRRGFFDERTCQEVIAEMRSARGESATVYGQEASGSVDERVRKAVRHTPSQETVEFVRRRLLECKQEIAGHFGVSLRDCEQPQFLRYRVGDFFVAHQDGNTGLLRLDQEARRVSVVIFLSRQSDAPVEGAYCGGWLVFHDWRATGGRREEFRLAGEPGTLVAFRSETTHEVTSVTHGERYSIACWYK
jgi:SM-20-related protein